jgi:hypothetical protein
MEADSPYDTLAPAVAQMEALVARIVAEHAESSGTRIEELERIRSRNTATIEGSKTAARRAPEKKKHR